MDKYKDLPEFPPIKLYKGATSIVKVDLTRVEMKGGYIILTIKDSNGNLIKEVRMTEPKVNTILFADEFTATLTVSNTLYKYDIMHHYDDERFPKCAVSKVYVLDTVGGM